MPRYFLDSSALVKRYHHETGSAVVDALFDASDNRLIISKLAIVETQSAFARLVREGVLTSSDLSRLVSRLEDDVAGQLLAVAAVSSRRLDDAAQILRTHGLVAHIRTLDAIHLATAYAVHTCRQLAAFVAADKKLSSVSVEVYGCAVIDVG